MLTETQRGERNRAGVRKWYGENREGYNALRRARYEEDPEARVKAQDRAAQYRKDSPTIERKLFRDLNGRRTRVFSTGEVASLMKRTPQMLRNWQKEGLIPQSSFPDKHRLYTKKQVTMLVRLDAAIRDNAGSWAAPAVKKQIASVAKHW